jgi:hypothetical protein
MRNAGVSVIWMVLRASVLLALPGLGLGGCAGGGPAELAIAPGEYPAAFDTAREVLRDARFDIDRVDARAGVLTTSARASTGLSLPWDLAFTDGALEDLLNRHARRIRVTFEPAAEGDAPPIRDLMAAEPAPLVMRVRVLVEREQRPGWRLESSSVQLSTRSSDPALAQRGLEPSYTVALREDPELSGRLTGVIAERLAAGRGGAGE